MNGLNLNGLLHTDQQPHKIVHASCSFTTSPWIKSTAQETGCNIGIFTSVLFLISSQKMLAWVYSNSAWKIDSSNPQPSQNAICLTWHFFRISLQGMQPLITRHQKFLTLGGTSNPHSFFQCFLVSVDALDGSSDHPCLEIKALTRYIVFYSTISCVFTLNYVRS